MTMSPWNVVTPQPQGPPGPLGPPGPNQLTVATAVLLTAVNSTTFPYGTQATVSGLKQSYYLDPTSTATPDQNAVIPATIGNWVISPGVGILGRSLNGTCTFGNFPEPGTTIGWTTIAAGQTAIVWSLPAPAPGFGEEVTVAASVSVQSAVAPLVVLGATGSGVSPIVLQVADTSQIQTGSLGIVAGILGNTAANTVLGGGTNQSLTVIDATHVQLDGTTGNGAYTSGGSITIEDFGRWGVLGEYRNCGGNICNSQGGTGGQNITIPASPSNAVASVAQTLVATTISGGTIAIQVTAPVGSPVRAIASGSYGRFPIPGAGPAPTITAGQTWSAAAFGPSPLGSNAFTIFGSALTSAGLPGGSVSINIGGTLYACTFSVANDGTINAVAPPGPAFGGTGYVVVVTANGVASTPPGSFAYKSDPRSIWGGANVRGWYPNSGIVQAGGVVTKFTDYSGNGQDIPAIGAPVYNAASTHITPAGPTATCNGTADGFINATFQLGATPGQTQIPVFMWAVLRVISADSPARYVIAMKGQTILTNDQVYVSSGNPTVSMAGATFASGVFVNGTMHAIAAWSDGKNVAGNVSGISISGATPVTQTSTGFGRSSACTVSVCVNNLGTGNYLAAELVDFGVVELGPTGTLPSTPQLAAHEAWVTATYGVV